MNARGLLRCYGPLMLVVGAAALGCIDVKEHLSVRKDGSGTVRIEIETDIDPEVAVMMRQQMASMGGIPAYPPFSADDAKSLFPGDAFSVETTLDKGRVSVSASFKDVNALLASPYGEVHSLRLEREGGELRFTAVSGLRGLLEMAGAKDKSMRMLPGPMAQLKKNADKMKTQFTLTLPNRITASSGQTTGYEAAWSMDRARLSDHDEACKELRKLMEARARDTGLSFSPKSPMRLGLVSFDKLSAGASGEATETVDAEADTAAAKFVPYRLKTVRHFDLAGEGQGGWNQGAHLTGAVILPKKYEPQKWDKPELKEVIDDAGESLLIADDRTMRMSGFDGFDGMYGRSDKPSDEIKHVVTLRFKTPGVDVRRIERLRGSIALKYFSGSNVTKLKDAIPASAIMDMSNPSRAMRGFNSSDRGIEDAGLDKLGIKISIQQCMYTAGMTQLALSVESEKATVTDIQVYDGDGQPHQSFMVRRPGMGSYIQVIVPGQPKGPYSLALATGGNAVSVTVPIELSNVPLQETK